ncbi:MAG: hypothetical protein ACREUZ_14590 [Burkholderiales bacterium]
MRNDLATHSATEIVGAIADHDVKRAERLVARHARRLKEEWVKTVRSQKPTCMPPNRGCR